MFFFDHTMLLLLPALVLSLVAQWMVQSTFAKYSRVGVRSGLSGAQAAERLARDRGLNVGIRASQGMLSDHYDPATNTLALSPDVYSGRSVSALGVAAHELGHALQKAEGYWPLTVRNGLVPLANIGSSLSMVLFFGGLLMGLKPLMGLGIVLFSLAVGFTLITLPVEFDASARAMTLLTTSGMVTHQEAGGVRKVLTAAALTYVAAAVMAIFQLLRLIMLSQSREE